MWHKIYEIFINLFKINQIKSLPNNAKKCYYIARKGRVNICKGEIGVYKALDVANYVIAKCCRDGHPISNLQLQKILYYIQGYFLKRFHTTAFPEKICNWPYGPVTPDVYFEYNIYGGSRIDDCNDEYIPKAIAFDCRAHRRCMDDVINACSRVSTGKLVEQTHHESPWVNTNSKQEITPDLIADFFEANDPLKIEN